MASELDIIRVALFECYEATKEKKKINVADLVGKKIFNLQKDKAKFETLKSTLEFNIKKKLTSKEAEDLSKSICVESAVSELFELNKIGRKPISLILNLKKDDESLFDTLLNSNTDDAFKDISASFSIKYVNYKKNVKGIIGFIQFDLKTNTNKKRFLSIITADYTKGVLSSDPSTAIRFLEKTFDQNFKNIIIYPYLKSVGRRTITTDNKLVKVHQRTADPDLFIISNIESPVDPQKIFDDLYQNMRGQISDLSEILEHLEEDYSEKVKVTIKFKNESIKIKLKDFLKSFVLINENSRGQGIFIKDSLINVEIAGKNLLWDQKIKYKSLSDLSKELNKEKLK